MKNLQLSLKNKWFEMTKSGEKKEDYREINEYWFKRLVFQYEKFFEYTSGLKWCDLLYRDSQIKLVMENYFMMCAFNPFQENIMTLGYPKKTDSERIIRLEHKGIEIREGKPEWGAEPRKLYFVVKHGKIL